MQLGDPLIDGRASKAPVAAQFERGHFLVPEQPVDGARVTVEVGCEG